MLDDLQLFVTTVDAGSLSKAAPLLGTTTATVSRRLDHLEGKLERKLLFRSARGLRLTKDGEHYYQACAKHLGTLNEVLAELHTNLNQLEGSLRVLVPGNFAAHPMAEFWSAFVQEYPQVELRIDARNQIIDLRASQADIALRIGRLEDSTLIQKGLGTIDTILVASPQFIDQFGPFTEPEQLERVASAGSALNKHWLLAGGGREYELAKHHAYVSNDLSVLTALTLSHSAVCLLPMSHAHLDLEQGRLCRILPDWQGPKRNLYLVWPSREARTLRSQVFQQRLTEFLQQQPWFTAL